MEKLYIINTDGDDNDDDDSNNNNKEEEERKKIKILGCKIWMFPSTYYIENILLDNRNNSKHITSFKIAS